MLEIGRLGSVAPAELDVALWSAVGKRMEPEAAMILSLGRVSAEAVGDALVRAARKNAVELVDLLAPHASGEHRVKALASAVDRATVRPDLIGSHASAAALAKAVDLALVDKALAASALRCAAVSGDGELFAGMLGKAGPLAGDSDALMACVGFDLMEPFLAALSACAPGSRNEAALIRAASLDRLGMARLLLGSSDPSGQGGRALVEAAAKGGAPMLSLLLPRSKPEENGSRAFEAAAAAGQLHALEILAPFVDWERHGSAALISAVGAGKLQAAALVRRLARGRLDARPELAVEAGRSRGVDGAGLAQMLMPSADPSSEASEALRKAAREGDPWKIRRILGNSPGCAEGSRALELAAGAGHAKAVKALLPWFDPKERGSAALAAAALSRSVGCVEALLPGSDPLAGGSLALRAAVRGHGDDDIVALLLPRSDARAGGSEAFRLACQLGHWRSAELLAPHSDLSLAGGDALVCAARRASDPLLESMAHAMRGDLEALDEACEAARGLHSNQARWAWLDAFRRSEAERRELAALPPAPGPTAAQARKSL